MFGSAWRGIKLILYGQRGAMSDDMAGGSYMISTRIIEHWNRLPLKKKLLIDFRERKEWGDINLLFHLSIHSLVESCMCPHQELNPQPWGIETML